MIRREVSILYSRMLTILLRRHWINWLLFWLILVYRVSYQLLLLNRAFSNIHILNHFLNIQKRGSICGHSTLSQNLVGLELEKLFLLLLFV